MKRKKKSFRPHILAKVTILCLALLQAPFLLTMTDGTGQRAYAATPDRALYQSTYLWKTDELLKNRESTFQFLQENSINLAFLQIDPDVPQSEYISFIQQAGARGIEVHALGGAPDWTLRHKQVKLYELIHWVKLYNNSAPQDARFTGIHLDVEPYVTKEWFKDTDTMIGLWKDTISGFVEEMRIETPGLVAGADMPVWLEAIDVPDGHGGRTSLSNWMIRMLDQTTLMAYRDNAAAILGSVQHELAEAERNGKSVIVAVETVKTDEGPITFHPKGKNYMKQELSVVNEKLKHRLPFHGHAIHDFHAWIQLRD
ncbi:hypothetical protein [Paenibacillus xerothermodurans]|uniref:Amidase n=1 Tax=Paenibacillus xerothermodurans TaxID=1977292 RepID=A0A2W1NM90_PAEXE|nr:hypothetical protein [Paenibacillus xerothermodurans]PZE20575.1 hypothetical protein CBW46_012445 [Paenibacillus xerothermodurans]